jgi:hypothetical protein
MSTEFTLHFDPEGAVRDAARECEAAVFLDRYGNTADQWAEEYGPYDPASIFISVTDRLGFTVAAMRIIVPSTIGLKSVTDLARPPWSIDGGRAARAAGLVEAQTWDVATIAIRRNVSRGGLLAAAMYHAVFRGTRANNIRWIVMIMDVRARRLLDAAHIHTQLLPGTRPAPYLGSAASVPLWGHMPSMADRQRRLSFESHRLINLGVGLDGISLPRPTAFVLAGNGAHIDQPAEFAMRSGLNRASA